MGPGVYACAWYNFFFIFVALQVAKPKLSTIQAKDIILHECTPGFDRTILTTHLPAYIWIFPCQADDDGVMNPRSLSPFHFGWPCQRDRAYTVGLLRETVQLECPSGMQGFDAMQCLFKRPTISVQDLFCAPEARYGDSCPDLAWT